MKKITVLLLAIVLSAGVTATAFAQDQDDSGSYGAWGMMGRNQ